MSQKPRQENFRKNLVNTVKFYRKTEKTAKGSDSEKIICDVSKHKFKSALQYTLRSSVIKGRT